MSEQPRIAEGRTYIIKSCRPTIHSMREDMHWMGSELHPGDREFMVVGAGDHSFRTQRPRHRAAKLALVQPIVQGDMLTIRASGHGNTAFPLERKSRPTITTEVWGDRVRALLYHEASEWFSDLLHEQCHLVRQSGTRFINRRTVSQFETVSLADRYPLLGISVGTLNKLNALLSERVSMDRFRPNLIFDNCKPQEENHWKHACFDQVPVYGVKPCTRCEMVDIDQETAFNKKDVAKVLAVHFRGAKNKPVFGENFQPASPFPIRIGSAVDIRERREEGWDRDYDENPHFGRLGMVLRVTKEYLLSWLRSYRQF